MSHDSYVLEYMYVYVCNKPHQPRPKRAIQPAAFNGPQPRQTDRAPTRQKHTTLIYSFTFIVRI